MTDYCVQSDVEGYLNLEFAYNPDPVIAAWITGASKAIDSYCRHDFDQHDSLVEYHDGEGKWGEQEYQNHNSLFLKQRPVISVASVDDNGTSLVVDDDYVVYEDKAMIRLVPDSRYFAKKRKGITVTYTHGFAAIPADVKDVSIRLVAESVKEMMRFSETGGAKSVSLGGISVTHAQFEFLPEWAKLALKEYVQWGFS